MLWYKYLSFLNVSCKKRALQVQIGLPRNKNRNCRTNEKRLPAFICPNICVFGMVVGLGRWSHSVGRSKQRRWDIVYRNFVTMQIYCLAPYIVYWLPNNRFAWLQSCEGFVNMSPDWKETLDFALHFMYHSQWYSGGNLTLSKVKLPLGLQQLKDQW
jgi:hypothetical protein